VGTSGAGQLIAAEAVAGALGLSLHRIDLAAVVSKYIGETEKNLRRVFDAAEDGGAVLFFDEADALFGKRSEVKDSHDRYANINVDDLLELIRAFRGVIILGTETGNALAVEVLGCTCFVVMVDVPGQRG
jgi:SpoVK/Ycf46/Vps4 family AAA+-type ATPase